MGCSRSIPQPLDGVWHGVPPRMRPFPGGVPASYPAAKLLAVENPALFEKLDTEALFFAFYYQPGSYQQYLAARELKRQSWRYHKQHAAWFQARAAPCPRPGVTSARACFSSHVVLCSMRWRLLSACRALAVPGMLQLRTDAACTIWGHAECHIISGQSCQQARRQLTPACAAAAAAARGAPDGAALIWTPWQQV